MIGEEDVRSGERIRDARGRFVARVRRKLSVGRTPKGEEGSGEHGEEQPEWDFTDFRRRSSFRAAQQQVGARHVMAAQIKFQSPPTFGGKDGEEIVQWMHRYERIGRYNRWGDEELRDHVELSLSGAAQKWYSYKEATGQLAAEWEDVAGPPIVPGVKTQ
ncbi:Uncharacterized protein APZ42_000603, partial [Daphnia magna]